MIENKRLEELKLLVDSLTKEQLDGIWKGINPKDENGQYLITKSDFMILRKSFNDNVDKYKKGKIIHGGKPVYENNNPKEKLLGYRKPTPFKKPLPKTDK